MSILLDALKKSEKQRQLGETPNIHTPVESSAAAEDSLHQWLPLTMMAVTGLAIAWLGFQQFRAPDQPASVEGAELAQAIDQEAATVPSPVPAEAQAESRTPVESFQAGQEQSRVAAVMPPTPESLGQSMEERRVTPVSDYRAEEPLPDEAAADAGAPEIPRPEDELAESVARAAPQDRRSRSDSSPAGPISYWELPQSVRDSLGELRITVLVYAEKTVDRFLLMNGERLQENEEVQPGLMLAEIRRDGAVFTYRSYRFLVEG